MKRWVNMSTYLQDRENHCCDEFLETKNIFDVDKDQLFLMIRCKSCGATIISPLSQSTHKSTHVSPTII